MSLQEYYESLLKREEEFPQELRAGYEAILYDIREELGDDNT